jgi:hypothetical protein
MAQRKANPIHQGDQRTGDHAAHREDDGDGAVETAEIRRVRRLPERGEEAHYGGLEARAEGVDY